MKVFELLNEEKRWCKHFSARTKEGGRVNPLNLLATSWCLGGAIARCYLDSERKQTEKKLAEEIRPGSSKSPLAYGVTIVDFNDNATYEEVIAVCKKANI